MHTDGRSSFPSHYFSSCIAWDNEVGNRVALRDPFSLYGCCRHTKAIKTMDNEVKTEVQPASVEPIIGGVEKKDEANIAPAPEKKIDYQAELERVTRDRDNYRQGFLTIKKKHKDGVLTDEDIQKEETIISDEELDRIINEKVEQKIESRNRSLVADTIEDQLEQFASDESEKALIKFHYENTIRQSGISKSAITADIRRAKLIANEQAILSENEALKGIVKSKRTMSNIGAGNNQDKPVIEPEQQFTPEELALLKRRNIDPKTVKR